MFKKIFISILIISLLNMNSAAYAVSADENVMNTIKQLVESENDNNWDLFTSLWIDEEKELYKNFFSNPDNQKQAHGVYTVKSAKLVEIQPISLSDLSFMNVSHNADGSKLKAYIIGMDYKVTKESKYYYNGVNYHLIILAKENNKWYISEYQDAPIEFLLSNIPDLNQKNVNATIKVIEQRKRGNIVNLTRALSEGISTDIAITTYSTPSDIRVYCFNDNNSTVLIDFLYYCEYVLPNEWVTSWPTQALDAGAIAVAQYGWYHTIHPKHSSLGCDVCDRSTCCQVFIDNSDQSSTNTACVNMHGKYLLSTSGTLFETGYRAGTFSSDYQYSGLMRQNGTHYWADVGEDWRFMCHYYYDFSTISTSVIQIIG